MNNYIINKMPPLLFLLLFCSSVQADPWTKEDTAWQAGVIAAWLVDWGQTLNISDNPDDYHEISKLLAEHPSRGDINRYFAGTLFAHTLITAWLPQKYRRSWQIGWLGIRSTMIIHNSQTIGFRLQF